MLRHHKLKHSLAMDVLVFLFFHVLLNAATGLAGIAAVIRIGQLKKGESKIDTKSALLVLFLQFLEGLHWLCSGGGMVVDMLKGYIWMKCFTLKRPNPDSAEASPPKEETVRKRTKILPPPLPVI